MNNIIAIVGNADSFWVQRFIANVSIPLGNTIALISPNNTTYKEYYSNNSVTVITTKPTKKSILGHRIDALRVTFNTINALRRIKPTIIHVHYAYIYVLRALSFLAKSTKRIITFWGSDLLRANEKDLLIIKRSSEKADALVVGAEDLYSKLIELDGAFDKKISMIRMGISAFDSIDSIRDKREEVRQKLLGKSVQGKTVITIGYNAGRAQQHLKVLECLQGLSEQLKKRIMIILPLTYQNEDVLYINSIRDRLENCGIAGILLTQFMNDEQIAEVCLSTDVFINAQTTDALSASMLEQLYSGSLVLNASWLHYDFLESNNIYCESFDSFHELKEKVDKAVTSETLSNYNTIISLKNSFSWNVSKEKWKQIYCSLM